VTDERHPDLTQVLTDARGEAAVLRSHGHVLQAESIEKLVEAVAKSMEDYLTLLTETEAMLFTGRKQPYLRDRFWEWQRRGLAVWDEQHHRRLYRRLALEHRGNAEAARQAGREAVRSTG
jgi:hypothetical protein